MSDLRDGVDGWNGGAAESLTELVRLTLIAAYVILGEKIASRPPARRLLFWVSGKAGRDYNYRDQIIS